MSWVKKFFEDGDGAPSSIRLQMLAITAAVLAVLVAMTAAILTKRIPDVPAGLVTLCSLVFGGAVAGKVIQQKNE